VANVRQPGGARYFRAWIEGEARILSSRSEDGSSILRIATGTLAWLVIVIKWRFMNLLKLTPVVVRNRFQLLRIGVQAVTVDGLWLEFGVAEGTSINFLAMRTGERIWGFDSFEGLPGGWTPFYRRGALSRGGKLPRVAPNVTLIKGLFNDTIAPFLERTRRDTAFVHVDCDLYESARTVLSALASRVVPGTVVVFDEFCAFTPDDEAKAFKQFCLSTGRRFEYLGVSIDGSVAIVVRGTTTTGAKFHNGESS
jgi:hypothetical protein